MYRTVFDPIQIIQIYLTRNLSVDKRSMDNKLHVINYSEASLILITHLARHMFGNKS